MAFACKATDGWQPFTQLNESVPGRCDANGLLQGEGIATAKGGAIRARFVDGRPTGPATMSSDPKRLVPGNQVDYLPLCSLNFEGPKELAGEIRCMGSSPVTAFESHPLSWSLSSPTVLKLEWVPTERRIGSRRIYPGIYFTTDNALIRVDGPLKAKLIPRELYDDHIHQHSGKLLGTTDGTMIPLFTLVSGDLSLLNASAELQSIRGLGKPFRPVWMTQISGQFSIRFPHMQIAPEELFAAVELKNLENGHPVNREMSIKYSNGYEATFIKRQGGYFYFRDNRDLEFNGLIPECLSGRNHPGFLEFNNRLPPRYLLSHTVVDGSNVARRVSENLFLPRGCGSFKSGGNPEMRGLFRNNADGISVTPF